MNKLNQNEFGKRLRFYRQRCMDAERGGMLTQKRLGELMGEVLDDAGYSGAAVSLWELGRSQIHKDQRRVLIALLKILHDMGGLQSLAEANSLLAAGHYSALGETDQQQVFAGDSPAPRPGLQDEGRRMQDGGRKTKDEIHQSFDFHPSSRVGLTTGRSRWRWQPCFYSWRRSC